MLLTNSPRPRGAVETQIEGFGVPRDAWDVITTSGDSARAAAFDGAVGEKVYFIGLPEEEDVFLQPLKIQDNPIDITTVPVDEAEGIVCTGPFDPLADPADLRPQLLLAKTRGLKLLCANPDIVVERGERLIWCAGALARLYEDLGGEVAILGKPHAPIYDAAMKHKEDGTPLVVVAGKEYGTGSSRDWAAKGTILLGVRATIVESYERIHRSNLIGMGVLPLQFAAGDTRQTLGLGSDDSFTIKGLADLTPGQDVEVEVTRANGDTFTFTAKCRIDTANEMEYYRNGGILHYVLRKLAAD